jgi:hypothetical protein
VKCKFCGETYRAADGPCLTAAHEVIAKLLAAIDAHRADNLRIYSTDDLHDNTLYAVADAVREGR